MQVNFNTKMNQLRPNFKAEFTNTKETKSLGICTDPYIPRD